MEVTTDMLDNFVLCQNSNMCRLIRHFNNMNAFLVQSTKTFMFTYTQELVISS